jgi:hypothetical protein
MCNYVGGTGFDACGLIPLRLQSNLRMMPPVGQPATFKDLGAPKRRASFDDGESDLLSNPVNHSS